MANNIQELIDLLQKTRMDLLDSIRDAKVNPNQVQLNTIAELSKSLGLFQAFDLRGGNKQEIGSGFTGVRITDTGIYVYNNDVITGRIDVDGDWFVGSNISAPSTTGFSIFSNDQPYNGEAVGAGDILIGDNSTGVANLFWDASAKQLQMRIGTITTNYMSTSAFTQISGKLDLPLASAQSVGAGPTTITFTTEVWDDSGFIDLGDMTRITIPTGLDGIYTVGCNAAFSSSVTGLFRAVYVRLNGSVPDGIVSQFTAPSNATATTNFAEDMLLAAGDYLDIQVVQNSGGNLDFWGNLYARRVR